MRCRPLETVLQAQVSQPPLAATVGSEGPHAQACCKQHAAARWLAQAERQALMAFAWDQLPGVDSGQASPWILQPACQAPGTSTHGRQGSEMQPSR